MNRKIKNYKNSDNKNKKSYFSKNKNNYEKHESTFNSKDSAMEENRGINEKNMKKFGIAVLILSIALFFLPFSNGSVIDSSESAKNALANRVSTAISAGVVLLSSDENVIGKDYTISHKVSDDNTKIWVWDYAAEDGDYVQVLVNGTPITKPFMIKNKPREFTVPTTGDIQVKGIKDGGGGITYAIRYDFNSTSYFNGAPEGEFYRYTLIRE